MAKTLYENLVYVPGASTDTISNASTGAANSCVGGDIMDNFKKIANVIHPTSFGNNCISVGGFECYGSGGQSLVTGSYSCNNGYCSIIAGIYCENNKSHTILTGYKAVSTESDSFEVGNDSITSDIRGITGMKHWSGSSAGSLSVDLLTVTLPGSEIVDADVIVYVSVHEVDVDVGTRFMHRTLCLFTRTTSNVRHRYCGILSVFGTPRLPEVPEARIRIKGV